MDLREKIFESINDKRVTACIYTDMDGVLAGMERACDAAAALGLNVDYIASNGATVLAGDLIMQLEGAPMSVAMAEDQLIGLISKPSGIATAARRFVRAADGKIRVVCGSWKKMPLAIKEEIREAAATGGAHLRITDEPMVYLDKNYVEMFGGIRECLEAVSDIRDRKKAIQVRGRTGDIVREAQEAMFYGADIVFIDTGRIEDAAEVCRALRIQMDAAGTQTEFAYGGGIRLEEMEKLTSLGLQVVDVGRAVIDAPLLDLRLEVTEVRNAGQAGNYDLLNKNELKIEQIQLSNVNLNVFAHVVADVLGIDEKNVLVIDVRDNTVALDILQSGVDPHAFVAGEGELLKQLAALEGVTLSPDTHIASHGMMGWIVGDDAAGMQTDLDRSSEMVREILEKVSRRAMVFSSGIEVERGEIEDTNAPLIRKKMEACGFETAFGGVLKDDTAFISGALRRASEQGYGVVITTGGVGAEDKDHSVEAICALDAQAATPYIVKFVKGHGRHTKDGIRIGVGRYQGCLLIALPGPNDEVSLCMDTLTDGLCQGWSREVLAWKLAEQLRSRWKEKTKHHAHE